jgi:hypothetical protein
MEQARTTYEPGRNPVVHFFLINSADTSRSTAHHSITAISPRATTCAQGMTPRAGELTALRAIAGLTVTWAS